MERYVRGAGTTVAYTEDQIAALNVPDSPYFTSGDPDNNIAPTEPGAMWFAMITEELRAVVVEAGLSPNIRNWRQVAEAIRDISIQESVRFNAVPASVANFTASAPSGSSNVLKLEWSAAAGGSVLHGDISHYLVEYSVDDAVQVPIIVDSDTSEAYIYIDESSGPSSVNGSVKSVGLTGVESAATSFSVSVPYRSAAGISPNLTLRVFRLNGAMVVAWTFAGGEPADTWVEISVTDSNGDVEAKAVSNSGYAFIPGLFNGESYIVSAKQFHESNGSVSTVATVDSANIAPSYAVAPSPANAVRLDRGLAIVNVSKDTADATPTGIDANTFVGVVYSDISVPTSLESSAPSRSVRYSKGAETDANPLYLQTSMLGVVWDSRLQVLRLYLNGRYSFIQEQINGFYLNINDGSDTKRFDFIKGYVVSGTDESYIEWDVLESPFANVGDENTIMVVNG